MKTESIKEALSEELKDRLSEEVEAFQKLKLSNSVSPLDNPKLLKEKRRFIARIRTELQQRNLSRDVVKDNAKEN